MAEVKLYQNFVLANEIENQLISAINHQGFCTIDDSLVGTAGMKKLIHKYTATSGFEKLGMGEGNTKSIGTSYTEEEYAILLGQTRFEHFDEQQMTDPVAVATGAQMIASDLWNGVNADIIAEFYKADSMTVSAFGFDAIVDGVASMTIEPTEEDPANVTPQVFALVNKMDIAKIRKDAKDNLKYVEAFVRQGYVGTLAGVNLYVDTLAEQGKLVLATRKAVTFFNKTGIEIESEREANIRKTTDYARKYYLAALTDARKARVLTIA